MHHGSCLCGAVKYCVDDDLMFVVNCHCHRISGGVGARPEYRGGPVDRYRPEWRYGVAHAVSTFQ
jgi:hypothetical protein